MVAGAFSAMMATGYTGAKTYCCGVVSLTVEEPSAIVTKSEKSVFAGKSALTCSNADQYNTQYWNLCLINNKQSEQ